MRPDVSIVLPIYNGAKYIGATLDAVLGQTHQSWELLVYDDASTDDTPTVLSAYVEKAQGRMRVLRDPAGVNRGQFAGRIAGSKAARSETIALLDADDVWRPNYLERSLAAWRTVTKRRSNLAFAFTPATYWYPDKSAPDFVQPMPDNSPRTLEPGELLPSIFDSNYMISPCPSATIIRRDVLQSMERFARAAHRNLYEDQFLWIAASSTRPIHCNDFSLMLYRQHNISFSRGWGEAAMRERSVVDERTMLREIQSQLTEVPEAVAERLSSRAAQVDAPSALSRGRAALVARTPEWLRRKVRRVESKIVDRTKMWAESARTHVRDGVEPLSYVWGFDRGTPIHRHYLESFLRASARVVKGRVLEFQNDEYASIVGGSAITKLDILHIDDTNPRATLIADLTKPNDLPSDAFDCVICTHVLHIIPDFASALRDLHRVLKPGGTLLVAVPLISMYEPGYSELWRFTPEGLRTALAGAFAPDRIEVAAYGNSLVSAGELRGLVAEDFSRDELAWNDPRFALEVCGRATK